MIDEKRLLEKLAEWERNSREEVGLKEPALLRKVAEEVKDMAVNEEIRQRIEREDANDGWTPVTERLPEEKINPVTGNWYEYLVTFKRGDTRDLRHYAYGDGHWWDGPQIMDDLVTAWMPLPEPYTEIDWKNVPIDTPILVKECNLWRKRYFAGVDKMGTVMAWRDGRTSFTESERTEWHHAKLWEGSREQAKEEWQEVEQ